MSTGAWLRAVIEQAVAMHRRPGAAPTVALQNLIDVYLSPAPSRRGTDSDELPPDQVRIDAAALLEPLMALLEPIAAALRDAEPEPPASRGAAGRGTRAMRHPRTALGNAPTRRLASTRRKIA